MARVDLVLLHAPSVYDFRETSIMYGPVSDMVPSTPVFEMYPIGLTTLAEYLERHGLRVRIVNLAVHMLKRRSFDVERAIRSLEPILFGIDLHWLPHAQGSLEIARLAKELHPDIPVVFGGLTATFFHQELIEYPQVDLVMRGDSTEEPMRRLLAAIRAGGSLDDVPNLTWKAPDGSVTSNGLDWVPDDLNDISLDYSYNMRAAVRHRDLTSVLPFRDWLDYPVCAALTSKGCCHNCVTCGGSAYAFRTHFGRKRAAFRDPELVARDIAHMQRFIPGPVFVLNDPLQAGEDYAHKLVEHIGKQSLINPVAFEFFAPPPAGWWEFMSSHLREWSAEISMESHDDEVRAAFGRRYRAEDLEASVEEALRQGCRRFDLYFMTGLPTQTADSVRGTPDYVRGLYERLGPSGKRLLAFVSPMAPSLDPGSMVFDRPEQYGYSLRARTLEEHRKLLSQPTWKHILNYESDAMSREELVDSTYAAALGLNRVKCDYGVIPSETATETEERIHRALKAMSSVEAILAGDPAHHVRRIAALREHIGSLCESTVCEKTELNWPTRARLSMVVNVILLWLRETLRSLGGRRRPTYRPEIERTEV